jgi:hypothetical protein
LPSQVFIHFPSKQLQKKYFNALRMAQQLAGGIPMALLIVPAFVAAQGLVGISTWWLSYWCVSQRNIVPQNNRVFDDSSSRSRSLDLTASRMRAIVYPIDGIGDNTANEVTYPNLRFGMPATRGLLLTGSYCNVAQGRHAT